MQNKIIGIVCEVLKNSNMPINLPKIKLDASLRKDLNFDSLMLAELTSHIDEIYNVDIFEDNIVDTINEIVEIINAKNISN